MYEYKQTELQFHSLYILHCKLAKLSYYYPEIFGKEVWFYINTHFFGAKYIGARCDMKVADLREYVFSWDGRDNMLEHALFCSGGKLEISLDDEIYPTPSYQVCNGSYRFCKQRLPIKDLVDFLEQVSGGGDINCGDFLCIETIDDRVFALAHRQYEGTHIFEIDKKWVNFEKITPQLSKKLLGFQGESILSPLSLTILASIIVEFDHIDNPQDYYKAVNILHTWANLFEYNHRFVRKQLKKDPDFFYGSDYVDGINV